MWATAPARYPSCLHHSASVARADRDWQGRKSKKCNECKSCCILVQRSVTVTIWGTWEMPIMVASPSISISNSASQTHRLTNWRVLARKCKNAKMQLMQGFLYIDKSLVQTHMRIRWQRIQQNMLSWDSKTLFNQGTVREHPPGIFLITFCANLIIIIMTILIFIWVGLSHGPTNKSWLFALCRESAPLLGSAPLYQKGTAAGALWRLSSHSTRKMPADGGITPMQCTKCERWQQRRYYSAGLTPESCYYTNSATKADSVVHFTIRHLVQ